MMVKFITDNIFMSVIAALGLLSIFIQWIIMLSIKGYVKASANMKTTRKKVMINLKNQFEAMYGMNVKVRNMDAYVDKYIYKLRFAGVTYSSWEKLPYITAGLNVFLVVAGCYYGFRTNAVKAYYANILTAGGINLACLYLFFHIFGIKTRKQQIHVQLVDYLENYLTNHLIKTVDNRDDWEDVDKIVETAYQSADANTPVDKTEPEVSEHDDRENCMEEDMDMLKRLIREMDAKREVENASGEVAAAVDKQSDMDLLEEFVQSFLS